MLEQCTNDRNFVSAMASITHELEKIYLKWRKQLARKKYHQLFKKGILTIELLIHSTKLYILEEKILKRSNGNRKNE